MDDKRPVRVEARFCIGNKESTSLVLQQNDHGSYDVTGIFSMNNGGEFPSHEIVVREGAVYAITASRLAHDVCDVGRRSCYHHYRHDHAHYYAGSDSGWTLQVEYADGQAWRAEGQNDAPHEIDVIYETLVAFGMPALRLGRSGSFMRECSLWVGDTSQMRHLLCYEELLAKASSSSLDAKVQGSPELLAAEFCDDVKRFAREQMSTDAREVLEAWGVTPDYHGLCGADLTGTTRDQVYALFAALIELPDPVQKVLYAYESKLLKSWWDRLRVIPKEERALERQRLEQERQERVKQIDAAVRERMASGQAFTSRDLAEVCGTTPREVSTRVRKFVRSGELKRVGDEYPCTYQVA